jgi:DNA-binding transcriptional LysR family regulator
MLTGVGMKLSMQMRQLRYFIKVAEVGSITAAARELGMTQPALSRQVRAFEGATGWALIEIDGGLIRIGYAPSLGGGLIKRAMAEYVKRYPGVKIELVDASSEEMRKDLLSGTIDLILGAKIEDRLIDWKVLHERQLCLAVPMRHAWARRRKVSGEELDGERVLLLSRHEYPEYFRGVRGYFSQLGINAKVAGEFDGIGSLSVALEAGIGVALVAEGASVGDTIHLLRVEPAAEPVVVAVGWRGDRALDPVTAAFVEELVRAAVH